MANALSDLAVAMTMNPGLHLLVEQGLVNYHGAGHMMYLNAPSARHLCENVVGFIRDTDRL